MFSYNAAEFVLGTMTNTKENTKLELIWIPCVNLWFRGTYKGNLVDRNSGDLRFDHVENMITSNAPEGRQFRRIMNRYERFNFLIDKWEDDHNSSGCGTTEEAVNYLRFNKFRLTCREETAWKTARRVAARKFAQSGLTEEELELLNFFKVTDISDVEELRRF